MVSYEKFGIEYDSNYYIPCILKPEPFFFGYADVLEIPIFFADNGHFTTSNDFRLSTLNLDDMGVKNFLFHPFHIYMNSNSNSFYEKIKHNYKKFDFLKNEINKNPGTRDLFVRFLEYLEKNNIETFTLESINNKIRKNKV